MLITGGRQSRGELPWREVAEGHRSVETGDGRQEIRLLEVVSIAAGIAFPRASQAIQLTSRPVPAHTGRKGTVAHRPRCHRQSGFDLKKIDGAGS